MTLNLMVMERCYGYLMPAEQLIGFMASDFSNFKTLIIIQSTRQGDQIDEDAEKVFKEQIWMKSPNLFRSKVLDQNQNRVKVPDITYRQLLIANNKERLELLLSDMGINLHAVAFTRIDGIIAYRIGDKGPDSPKILVEKKRFLPLLLMYRSPENFAGDIITIRFRDYRKVEQGWYPFEILYSSGSKIRELYAIQTLEANVPVNPSLFNSPEKKPYPSKAPEKGQGIPEGERLRKIIKAFEEKYR